MGRVFLGQHHTTSMFINYEDLLSNIMYVRYLVISKDKFVKPIIDTNRSFHSNDGVVSREQLHEKNFSGIVKTSKNVPLLLAPATFKDSYEQLRRTAAIMIPKDIGFIIAETGLTKDSIVIEAGGGTGALTCALASLCKHVYTYEINPEHAKSIRTNCERMDLTNVTLIEEDVLFAKAPSKADILVLDMPDPSKALTFAKHAVKQSGFIAAYTPQISLAQRFAEALDDDFKLVTCIELLQRRWEIGDGKLRPKHNMLGHTAFLTIARKFSWSCE